MAQQINPWQPLIFAKDENTPPPAPQGTEALEESKKRKRGDERRESNEDGHGKDRKHKLANRGQTSQQHALPIHAEVINLLDEEDYDNGPRSLHPAPQSMLQQAVIEALPVSQGTQQPLPSRSLPHGPSVTAYAVPLPPPTSIVDVCTDDVVSITEPTLCPEQQRVVDLILSGCNVFYTGSAGCGKSTILKAFVRALEARGKLVHIVAPTGRAALDINGSTIWTYAGWTPDSHKQPLEALKRAAHGKFVSKRFRDTDVLVIDEISMVENLNFERLNVILKEARGSDAPFGGVQVVVTGDFCQLPPVQPFKYCFECGRELIKNARGTEYRTFRSHAWKECKFEHINLETIHRQSDHVFIEILQKLRIGEKLSKKDFDILLHHESETRNAVQLFATREQVKRINDERFANLKSTAHTYPCLDNFRWNPKHKHLESKGKRAPEGFLHALNDHRYESTIQLKKGMLVVLLHNLDLRAGLVNGSQGTIQYFEPYDPKKMPKTALSRGKEKGMEVDGPSTASIPVLGGDYGGYREEELRQYAKQMPHKAWPVVRFLNGVKRTIYADCVVNELGAPTEQPYTLLSRTQIPLMAAWAMTTHKSQGMTLNRVVVDLSRSFEEGLAYVALSRARSLEGLKVTCFPPSAQGSGNPQVRQFLKENGWLREAGDSQVVPVD